MKAFVFTDRTLIERAGQFVWLEMNNELARNAALSKRLKIAALPTFFVLDPTTEKVAIRWVGSMTVPQVHKLLDNGAMAVRGGGSDLDAMLARADQFYGAGEDSSAAVAYQAVLAKAPSDWPVYPRVMEALMFALSQTDQDERVVALAREAGPRLGRTPSGLSITASGLSAALGLKADHAGRAQAIAHFEPMVVDLVRDPAVPVAADDRSGYNYGVLVAARDDAKDEAGKKRVLEEWAGFLESAAAKAATPEQRTVFDSHRLSVYLELGQPERAVPMLQASEKDLPDDYNPPQRLAMALNAMKRHDEALAASDRAMAKAYGPRKFRIYQTRTDIHLARADSSAARATLEEAIRHVEGLPEEQRSQGAMAALRKRLTGLNGTKPTP